MTNQHTTPALMKRIAISLTLAATLPICGPHSLVAEDFISFGSDWEWFHSTDATDPSDEDADFETTWYNSDEYDGPDFEEPAPALFGYGTIGWGAITTDIGQPS